MLKLIIKCTFEKEYDQRYMQDTWRRSRLSSW